eukprot:1021354-Alexandrium_andersonii.AAC.1
MALATSRPSSQSAMMWLRSATDMCEVSVSKQAEYVELASLKTFCTIPAASSGARRPRIGHVVKRMPVSFKYFRRRRK